MTKLQGWLIVILLVIVLLLQVVSTFAVILSTLTVFDQTLKVRVVDAKLELEHSAQMLLRDPVKLRKYLENLEKNVED